MKSAYLPKAKNYFIFTVLGSKAELALTALAIVAVIVIIINIAKRKK